MKYIDFKNFTDENVAMPIYLFEGEESYFREKGEQLLKNKYLQEPTLDYASFEGNSLNGENVKGLIDSLNTYPFISDKRVVKITEFYPTEKEYEKYLKQLFECPPLSGMLLIVNTSKPKTGQANLSKKKNVTFVDCSKADEETIKKWIYITCKRKGVRIDGVTSGILTQYCNLDMARISKETEKLLSYCEGQGVTHITDELVDSLVYPETEYKIYELTNALSVKNHVAFVTILNELSLKGNNELSILSFIASYFKTLYDISVMKGSDSQIATALGVKEYAVKKNKRQISKFTKKQLLWYYQTLYESISAIKCGEKTPASALKYVTACLFFGKN